MVARLVTAARFLTRIPLPGGEGLGALQVGQSVAAFPLVGAAIGGLLALLGAGLTGSLPPVVLALLLVLVSTLITGALHLDGLADTADGFGGGRSRQDVLKIMRDSCVGSFGTVALILDLGLKVAVLAALVQRGKLTAALVAGGALSRWTPAVLAIVLPCARRDGGLGASVTDHAGWFEATVATGLVAVVVAFFAGVPGLCWWAGVAGLVGFAGWICHRRIGGVTGDTLGATIEAAETLVYFLALVML
jgi:adenosylcobinamide-GDP ribazoletransferase